MPYVTSFSPVNRSNASTYFAAVRAITSPGNCRAGRGLVPIERLQIIAHELFVETGRTLSDDVMICRPESRRIRRQHFIDQKQFSVDGSKFEFGVGENDSFLFRRDRARPNKFPDSNLSRVAPISSPRILAHVAMSMFSSWPVSAFVAGVKIGSGNFDASFRPAGKFDSANALRLLIFFPTGAGEITTHDAFDRQRLRFFHDHRPAFELLAKRPQLFRENVEVGRDEMIVDLAEFVEPKALRADSGLRPSSELDRAGSRRRPRCDRSRQRAACRRDRKLRGLFRSAVF